MLITGLAVSTRANTDKGMIPARDIKAADFVLLTSVLSKPEDNTTGAGFDQYYGIIG